MILVGVLLLCTIGNFILSSGSLYLERVNEKYVFVLLIICLAVKTAWIVTYKIDPIGDYEAFSILQKH